MLALGQLLGGNVPQRTVQLYHAAVLFWFVCLWNDLRICLNFIAAASIFVVVRCDGVSAGRRCQRVLAVTDRRVGRFRRRVSIAGGERVMPSVSDDGKVCAGIIQRHSPLPDGLAGTRPVRVFVSPGALLSPESLQHAAIRFFSSHKSNRADGISPCRAYWGRTPWHR